MCCLHCPEELKGLAENASKTSKADFLKAYQDGQNAQNLTRREGAQMIDAYMRRTMKITPEQFYDTYVAKSDTEVDPFAGVVSVEKAREMADLRDRKPRPLNRMYGPNPTEAQVAAHKKAMSAWNSEYRKASKAHAKAVRQEETARTKQGNLLEGEGKPGDGAPGANAAQWA